MCPQAVFNFTIIVGRQITFQVQFVNTDASWDAGPIITSVDQSYVSTEDKFKVLLLVFL